MNPNITLSLVIPVYNEAVVLTPFWQELAPILNALTLRYEVLFVDDGSQDDTWSRIRQLAAQHAEIRGVRFTRNFGKEAAILAGLEQAQGQAVVVMDGDGQHPPSLLPEMLDAWWQGYPLVVACKKERPNDSLFARVSARLFAALMHRLSGLDLVNSADYRLLDRKVVSALLACPEKIRFFRGMTTWTGVQSYPIAFSVPARLAGESHWSKLGLVKMALYALVSYSAKPLYYLFGSGIAGLLVSVLLGLQALYSWLAGIAVSGWTSLTLVILIFGSANLLGLGLLGIYVGQLFEEIKARPSYLIRETTNGIV
ncbi:MAG: glycosyltransferase family 2 protein [Methylovulum sp.]|nr:glycosyltransferase family 2 protein [Methylovulum sp.]